MEEVKILAKFMLIIVLGILAIICLFSIATEEHKNWQILNKGIGQIISDRAMKALIGNTLQTNRD